MEFLRNIKVHLKYQVRKTLFWLNIRRRYPYINKVPGKTINYIRQDNGRCTELFGMVDKQMESDTEPYHKRARQLLNAYQDGNPDLMLMALTGYSMESLVDKCCFGFPVPVTKEDYIDAIEKIIENYGGFCAGDLESGTSICLNNGDGMIHLAEVFGANTVTVNTYDEASALPVSSYPASYQNLELHILMDIYKLSLVWRAYTEDLS